MAPKLKLHYVKNAILDKAVIRAMQTTVRLPHYLDAREQFLRAMGKEAAQLRKMLELFGATNEAGLDAAMLRAPGKHLDDRKKYADLSTQLDYAARIHDLAKEEQRKKIALQQAQFNDDIKNIDC